MTPCRLLLVLLLILQQAVQVAFAALPQESWTEPLDQVVLTDSHHGAHIPASSQLFAEVVEEAGAEETGAEDFADFALHGQEASLASSTMVVVTPGTIGIAATNLAQRLHMPVYLWCRVLLI